MQATGLFGTKSTKAYRLSFAEAGGRCGAAGVGDLDARHELASDGKTVAVHVGRGLGSGATLQAGTSRTDALAAIAAPPKAPAKTGGKGRTRSRGYSATARRSNEYARGGVKVKAKKAAKKWPPVGGGGGGGAGGGFKKPVLQKKNSMGQLPPPVPPPSPGARATFQSLPRCKAVFDYAVTTPDDIPLKEGEFLRVLEQLPDGWCHGRSETTGKSGWFPTSYVEML